MNLNLIMCLSARQICKLPHGQTHRWSIVDDLGTACVGWVAQGRLSQVDKQVAEDVFLRLDREALIIGIRVVDQL